MDNHPLEGVLDVWEGVVEDMEATAAEYRENGWETLELHPGDVNPLPAVEERTEGRFGLDVLVPGEEYETVSTLVADAEFDEYEVFRAQRGGVVFLLLVTKSTAAEQVVLTPLYYGVEDARLMLERAREADVLYTHVRPLSGDEHVTFTQQDPELLFPE
ncbi:hypothetical protein SAMN04487948_108133 [Halogranum amylolyticum]|uniref:Uncharacterized protein n=1 Tax=Halogranum amylolyticum TaxID=660520 RepID=A0A1H8TVU8_9EURY|nr:hypothetical protein [Halogranum amylolyticum]SEO94548.1 hypothetical protein SAMN04487948_108133 [Halogranum amylolyticum]